MEDKSRKHAYREALRIFRESKIPFLVGGAYGLGFHTGIHRDTKDLDLFILPADCHRFLQVVSALGHPSRIAEDHWLAKVWIDDALIDLIFGLRNGLAKVEKGWFTHARAGTLFETPVRFMAVEELIWSKAFVMERDRYDGADIAHLIRLKEKEIDWRRLLDRFGSSWAVLFNHLVMFTFIYPKEAAVIPEWLRTDLVGRWQQRSRRAPPDSAPLCQGTLLSNTQYDHDVLQMGYRDARYPTVPERGNRTAASATARNHRRK